MKKIFLIVFALCLPGWCMAQISLEWMKAGPKKRKAIEEQRRALESERALAGRLEEFVPGLDVNMKLSARQLAQIWSEKEVMLLPLPGPAAAPAAHRVYLFALRAAKSWRLLLPTRAFLFRSAAYNYRVDFEKRDGEELYVSFFPVENKKEGGKRLRAEFFIQFLGGGRYGLFIKVEPLQDNGARAAEARAEREKNGDEEESQTVQIAVLKR